MKKRLLSTLLTAMFGVTALFAQAYSVQGIVTDTEQEPLIGVTVKVKNQSSGTITDADGKFTIKTSAPNAELVFSYVGFQTKTIKANGKKQLNVVMSPDQLSLDQVVVVGYGIQKKVDLTGAVASVNVDKDLTSRSLSNVSSALAGLMPGLSVSQTSGMAGNDKASLLIRGMGTINNASPLIVVDDMPDVDINRLNINDIESISVLKDATAASVYGSRAANGVILIKTKSGSKDKKSHISFSSSFGWEKATKSYKLLSNYPYAMTLEQRSAATSPSTNGDNQMFKDGTIDQWLALGLIDGRKYPNTDWFDWVFRTGKIQNYNVSASGGNDKASYYASIGYMNQKGLQINNNYNRYNVRVNFDYKVLKNVTTGLKLDGNWSKYQYNQSNGFTGENLNFAQAVAGILPYDALTDTYGSVMAYGESTEAYNPYASYMMDKKKQDRQEINATMFVSWEPIKGLTARLDYGLRYYNQFYKYAPTPTRAYNYQTESYTNKWWVSENAGVTDRTATGYKTMMNARLNYNVTLAEHHNLSAMFVYSEEYWYSRSNSESRSDRIHPSLSEINSALTSVQTTSGTSSREGLRSFIGRVNYSAYDRYLLEFNIRADGSSKFQPGHRYGYFPSLALGWRFTEEPLMKKITSSWLSNGKLRVSYGSLGNNSGISAYQQRELMDQNNFMFDGKIATGFVYSKMVNQSLSWEKTKVFNLGLDIGFLNKRLQAELDYYDRLTTGMLQNSQMSILLTGAYETPKANLGNLRNRGVEANITWQDHIGNFNYSVNANVSYNHTNLEKWGEFLDKGNVYIDMPYHFVYSIPSAGLAQTFQDVYNYASQGLSPGDVIRLDVNGDGQITANDYVAQKNWQTDRPTTNFALTTKANWKGIDFSMLWSGSTGRKDLWINRYTQTILPTSGYQATEDHITRPWSWENRDGSWPRLGGFSTNYTNNTYWLRDLTYFRMKNIQLGYTVPIAITKKFFVESLRVYFSAENLLTITNYEGLDPEKGASSQDLYPTTKSYSVGLNITF